MLVAGLKRFLLPESQGSGMDAIMSNVPADLLYTKDHEWVRLVDATTAVVGITDYAQSTLGDITFLDLPAPGRSFSAGEAFGVVESVKAASDLYMPLAGEVLEVNEALVANPGTINQDPYGVAWMIKVRLRVPGQTASLLDPAAYSALI